MDIRETIAGLEDLIRDRESFITKDTEDDSVFLYDIAVLKSAIELIEGKEAQQHGMQAKETKETKGQGRLKTSPSKYSRKGGN